MCFIYLYVFLIVGRTLMREHKVRLPQDWVLVTRLIDNKFYILSITCWQRWSKLYFIRWCPWFRKCLRSKYYWYKTLRHNQESAPNHIIIYCTRKYGIDGTMHIIATHCLQNFGLRTLTKILIKREVNF